MANLKFYKWSIALMMLVVSTSASAQLFPRNGNIFGNTSNRPVVRQDGSRQWPDGTIQYPDGTTRYPDGAIRYPNGTMSYPRNQRNDNRHYDNCSQRSNLPPGQAKKVYGGHARDYAKGRNKQNCNCNHRHDDRDWDDDRNVRNYPNQYPQYPSYPQYPNSTQQSGGKRPSRTTNPNL